jgi:hypothetical protein
MKTGKPASLPADVREVIVRQLAAALAEAWRQRRREPDTHRGDEAGSTATSRRGARRHAEPTTESN